MLRARSGDVVRHIATRSIPAPEAPRPPHQGKLVRRHPSMPRDRAAEAGGISIAPANPRRRRRPPGDREATASPMRATGPSAGLHVDAGRAVRVARGAPSRRTVHPRPAVPPEDEIAAGRVVGDRAAGSGVEQAKQNPS